MKSWQVHCSYCFLLITYFGHERLVSSKISSLTTRSELQMIIVGCMINVGGIFIDQR